MPRTARSAPGGVVYHVINRGNGRATVFHKPGDFDAFLAVLTEAQQRLPVDLLGFCLMPNHFHLVVRPQADGDLGRWVRRLLTTHAGRYHRHHGTSGHIWQGRYRSFPIQDDEHLATVLRYVERNPVRAELVPRAEAWPWSSLPRWLAGDPLLWSGEPALRGPGWVERVNTPLSVADLGCVQLSLSRGRPYGDPTWTHQTAERIGLESTLRGRGRPRRE